MHIDTKDPVVQLKITCVVCSSLAVASTIYRLYKRWGRLWADDLWALFASVAVILQLVAVFLPASAANKLIEEYLGGLAFQLIIWGSRLSMLFSIVRVDHSLRSTPTWTEFWPADPDHGKVWPAFWRSA
ncbi:hypothetical protein K438DRAFT_201287 [Mycena galopus ATCC 62051]|nr:hypothetical protein K438DRAFT_201287 [Mycena galopus ATCC 62051]